MLTPTRLSAARLEALEPRAMLSASPNDPQYTSQYALANTAVADAWATTTGSASTVVADIDSGIDYTHQDLYANVWINRAEIPTAIRRKLKDVDKDGIISFYDLNGSANRSVVKDANHNGTIDAGDLLRSVARGGWQDGVNGKSNANDRYVDDIVGWDFAENDNNPFDDNGDNDGHGTHTAGIIGAVGDNGVGISGVAQRCSIMSVRIFKDNGDCVTSAKLALAIKYSADNGARVSNNSWGGEIGRNGDVVYKAIQYAGNKGQLFVVAAGNDRLNLDSDFARSYPAKYTLDNILVVAASNSSGSLASWSDYGATQVDIVAPGQSIYSTLPHNRYGKYSGSSMATPLVTGAAVLMLSADSTLSAAQIKQRLIDGADESKYLSNTCVADGELNVYNAMKGVSGTDVANTTNPGSSGDMPWPGFPRFPFATENAIDWLP
jgi:serine protease